MKLRGLFFASSTSILMLSALVLGCGGGEDAPELSLREYFRELEQLTEESARREEPVEERFFAADDLSVAKEALAEYPDIASDFLAGLEAIEPPKEVERLHLELVDAMSAARDALDLSVERAQAAETFEELLMSDDPALTTAGETFDRICGDLQDVARSNGIDADLQCGDQ